MSHLRALRLRLPVLGGLIGLTGIVGILRARRPKRPTGAELAAMSDADFASFIRSSGVKTVTTAGLSRDGWGD
jgi:hypothetical protein